MDDQAARSSAALPGCAERAPQDRFDGEFHIGIVHDNDRVLAAEFKADLFALLRRPRIKFVADFGTAGEGDHSYIWMIGDGVADHTTRPQNDVDHAVGDSGVGKDADKFRAQSRRIAGGLENNRIARD